MALVLKDRVKETTTSTGTGSVVLAGAVTGFQSFASALADGDTTYYTIEDGTDWETGLGTWAESTSTLARTTIFESSNSSSAVDFGAGSKNVFITLPATRTATTKVYATIDDLPMTGNQAGDQAFVSATNRLYLFSGAGWYNIALINQTPTVTGNSASYVLSTDGTSTVITLSATDPEGIPIVWSHVATGLDSEATITNEDNVFTITPSTNTANEGEFSVTFRASDGVNIGTALSTFVLIFRYVNWDSVSLSVGTNSTNNLANSSFIDRSTNAFTVTPTGTPLQTSFHPYLDNWSLDNSDDNTALSKDFGAKPAPLEFVTDTTSDGTIEAWIYLDQTPDSGATFHVGSTIVAIGDTYFAFLVTSTLKLRVYWWSGSTNYIDSTGSVSLQVWHHVAMVKDGNAITFYIDGVVAGTGNITTISWASPSGGNYLRIANNFGSSDTAAFKGHLSNVRLTDAIVYSGAFTPATEALTAITNTTLLVCQSNRFVDNSTNAHTITVTGNPKISDFNPFGQESEYAAGQNKGSAFFDGNGDYLSNTVANLSLTAGSDWTVSFWYYTSSTSGTQMLVTGDQNTSGAFECFFSNGTLKVGGAGVAVYLTVPSGNLPLNAWTHVAIVRDTSNLATVYVNGISKVTATWSVNNPTTGFFVGGYPNLYPFNGYLSDIRWRIGQKDYTTNFTPPTAPVGNTSASLYLPMDNAGIFDKTGNNNLYLFGNTATSTTQTKYADTAMYFDGSGDYLTAGDIDLHTNDFTIETWFYQTATGQYSSIFSTTINTGTANTLRISTGPSNNTMQVASQNVALLNASTSFSNNVWNHVALTRSGSTLRLFLNGSQVGTVSNSTNFVGDNFIIGDVQGQGAPYYFTGYMENFQILKGVAKYTGNFTPPS
jgi:hypothetical protein